MMNATLVSLAIANYLSYAVAAKWFFTSASGVARRMVLLASGALICAVVFTYSLASYDYTDAERGQALCGMVLYTSALTLFVWALRSHPKRVSLAFSRDQPSHLVTSGPYRYIRHPFYAAYTLSYLAAVAATLSWTACALTGLMLLAYHSAARYEERKYAASELAELYANYKSKTGRFLPRIR